MQSKEVLAVCTGVKFGKFNSDFTLQVSVIDVEAYEVPAGNQLKEGSRKMRRREMYTPRSQQRQAAAAELAAVPV